VRRVVPRLPEVDNLAMSKSEYECFRMALRAARRAFDDVFQHCGHVSSLKQQVFGTPAFSKGRTRNEHLCALMRELRS
jgi:hypothetical protein